MEKSDKETAKERADEYIKKHNPKVSPDGWYVRSQGEPNQYSITNREDNQWMAVVKFNGEYTVERQGELIQRFVKSLSKVDVPKVEPLVDHSDNALIAAFIGEEYGWQDLKGVGVTGGYYVEGKYHKSWDSLKPVIDRIVELPVPPKESEGWYAYWSLDSRLMWMSIDEAYKDVVEYVKWYNNK